MAKTCLPDVNFWLALTFQQHEHYRLAANWFAEAPPAVCAFCRMTQQGFLRLATNPQVFGKEALTMADAWLTYDHTFDDPRVAFVEEPEDVETVWRSFTQRQSFSPKVWNDAYLAAFAQSANLELVTFDRGLGNYQGVRCTVLS